RGSAPADIGEPGRHYVQRMELIEVPPGLAGVAVTATTVGDVLGDEGIYHYRGRSAAALATSASFEEAAAIVLDASGGPAIGDATLPSAVADLMGRLDLRGGLSVLGAALDMRPLVDEGPDDRHATAVALTSAP